MDGSRGADCSPLSHIFTIVDTDKDLAQTMVLLFLTKKRLMRRTHLLNVLIAIFLVAGLLVPSAVTALSSTTIKLWIGNVSMSINGVQRPIDAQGTKPVIVAGRTLVPIRAVIEAFGGSTAWESSTRKVTVTLGKNSLDLWIGKSQASLNGTTLAIDAANSAVVPVITNGRTMLPLRFVAESLGIGVQYDATTRMITLMLAPQRPPAPAAGDSWTISTMDSTGDVGLHTSIAVDANEKVHISYIDLTNGKLKYMTNVTGSWVTWVVDSANNAKTGIAVDANGKCHIVYDGTGGDLKYATNATTASGISSIVEGGAYSGFMGGDSIALDSYGKAHISYFRVSDLDLKYATNASGTWSTSILVNGGALGPLPAYSASIGVDSNNYIHISYYDDASPDSIKYVTNMTGSWVATTIATIGLAAGWKTSLAVDSNNKIHVSYYDSTNDALKYASNASGTWQTETVDKTSGGVWDASLAVDKAHGNQVHMVYGSYSGFKYATKSAGTWQISKIDESWMGDGSIAIGSSSIHVSYRDGGKLTLKYATKPLS